jgi:hypothetical protein
MFPQAVFVAVCAADEPEESFGSFSIFPSVLPWRIGDFYLQVSGTPVGNII